MTTCHSSTTYSGPTPGARPRQEHRSRRADGAITILLLTLVLTDPIRKLAPSLATPAFLLIDGAVMLIYFTAFAMPRGNRSSTRHVRGYAILCFTTAAMVVFVLANMLATWRHLDIFLVGFHNYIFFAPLAFAVRRTVGEIRVKGEDFTTTFMLILGIVLGLGGVLSLFTDVSLLAPISEDTAIHTFGATEVVALRSGTFATSERLARTLLPLFFIAVAALYWSPKHRLAVAATVVTALGLLVTGRRFAIVLAGSGIVAIIIAAKRHSGRRFRRRTSLLLLSIVALAALGGSTMMARFLLSGSQELSRRSTHAFGDVAGAVLVGQGAGTSSPGREHFGIDASGLNVALNDSGLSRLVIEVGWAGMLLATVWGASITWVCVLAYRRSARYKSPIGVAAALYSLCLLIWYLKAHQTFGDPFSLACFWLAVGYSLRPSPSLQAQG